MPHSPLDLEPIALLLLSAWKSHLVWEWEILLRAEKTEVMAWLYGVLFVQALFVSEKQVLENIHGHPLSERIEPVAEALCALQ